MATKKNKPQDIADNIIKALEDGSAPWLKPWTPSESAMPHNPVSGTRYKGINILQLMLQSKPDPRWVTFKQATNNGWSVKRGTKGVVVQFWQFTEKKKQEDEQGTVSEVEVRKERPLLRHYYVFNASDIEGIPELTKEDDEQKKWQRQERAEQILTDSRAHIEHVKGDRAAYSPSADKIILPTKEQFETADRYYATALHELGHWTGHETRLDRDLKNPLGSEAYAREELRAEIASFITGMELEIGHDPGQHVAYVDSWIKHLKDHPTEIFKACSDAEKINTFIMDFEQERAMEKTTELPQETEHYIVVDSGLTGLSPLGAFDVNIFNEKSKEFSTKEAALAEALQIKARLNNEEDFYIHRVEEDNDISREPVISTEGKQAEKPIQDHTNMTPSKPQKTTTFISFVSKENQEHDSLAFTLETTAKKAALVVKLQNPLFHEGPLTNNLPQECDGLVLMDQGTPSSVILRDRKALYKTMFQAAKGEDRIQLNVPFADKNKAKEQGALWDGAQKSWFIPKGLGSKPFHQWLNTPAVGITTGSAQQLFAAFIETQGGDLQGHLPIMDGKIYRVAEKEAKKGNKNIAYVGYLDGRPAGWLKNHRFQSEEKWKLEGSELTQADKEKLIKESAEKRLQRKREREALHARKAQESEQAIQQLKEATGKEDYFASKDINIPKSYAKITPEGHLVLPLKDVSGKQWSHQILQENGFKQIFKDSKLEGNFGLIGADSVAQIQSDILIAEGYSTAATVHELTQQPVVVGVTANNLEEVIHNIKTQFPEKKIHLLADDDKHLPLDGKKNSGREMAEKLAREEQAIIHFPDFDHAQPAKDKTDFNDMARIKGKASTKEYIEASLRLASLTKRIEKQQEITPKKDRDVSEEQGR